MLVSAIRMSSGYYTAANGMFSGENWNQPVSVRLCVFVSVYKILLSVKALVGILSQVS